MKKNSIDLDNIKPECQKIKDELDNVQKDIDLANTIYKPLTGKLLLNKQERKEKRIYGTELYSLNIKAIGLIHKLAMCEEGREFE